VQALCHVRPPPVSGFGAQRFFRLRRRAAKRALGVFNAISELRAQMILARREAPVDRFHRLEGEAERALEHGRSGTRSFGNRMGLFSATSHLRRPWVVAREDCHVARAVRGFPGDETARGASSGSAAQ